MGNSYWTAVVFIETVWLIDCVLNSCDLRLKYSSDNSDRSPVIGWGCKKAPVNCPWAATFMFRFILEELAKSKDRCPAYLMQSRAITCMDAAPCKLSLILLSICLYASAGGKAGRRGGKIVLPEIPVGCLRRGCVKHFFLHKHLEIKLS